MMKCKGCKYWASIGKESREFYQGYIKANLPEQYGECYLFSQLDFARPMIILKPSETFDDTDIYTHEDFSCAGFEKGNFWEWRNEDEDS